MSFKFLFVPANQSEPIVEIEGSKSGGLENDALRKTAEERFSQGSIDRAQQKAAMAEQLKGKGVDALKIEEILASDLGEKVAGSVEIITLAVPKPANRFHSISLYCDGNSSFKETGKIPNLRATVIARLCGHSNMVIMGDCFAGRALDDERVEWERLDFCAADFTESAKWVLEAAMANAGKNLDSYSTSGALNAMQQQGSAAPAVAAAPPAEPVSEFSATQKFVWGQTEEEVEVRMRLPEGLLSKQLCVEFAPAGRLFVGRKNAKTPADAAIAGLDECFSQQVGDSGKGAQLQGPLCAGDCTWSVADEREGRLLTITLAKAKKGNWKSFLKA